jgi:hypothetical protein
MRQKLRVIGDVFRLDNSLRAIGRASPEKKLVAGLQQLDRCDLDGRAKNAWRLKTGFWYSRISDAISPARNETPSASAAPPTETFNKSRRVMIGEYITMLCHCDPYA